MSATQRRREHLLLPLLVGAVLVGLLLWHVRDESRTAAERVHYEDLALAQVRRVAEAEMAFHEREGRYGWLSELRRAGLADRIGVEVVDGRARAASPRYRIDVLLPFAIAPGDYIRIAPRWSGHDDRELQRRHFAVVARPWGDALTGFRTYYLDESGDVFVSEGVSDVASRTRRPLPDLHLSHGRHPQSFLPSEVAGLRFWPLARMPGR
jgi:hypothetical protein